MSRHRAIKHTRKKQAINLCLPALLFPIIATLLVNLPTTAPHAAPAAHAAAQSSTDSSEETVSAIMSQLKQRVRAVLTTAVQPAYPRWYTVKANDGLMTIAAKLYGKSKSQYWTAILKANKLAGTTIYTGQRLKIPAPIGKPPIYTSPDPVTVAATSTTPTQSTGSLQSYAQALLNAKGWGSQFWCLNAVIMRESSWNVYATNPYSGAYGIPQALPGNKMSAEGADWQTNGDTQLRWMINDYIGIYGGPCGAWNQEQATGSYSVSAVKFANASRVRRDYDRPPLRIRAFKWAIRQRGKPYVWGGPTEPGTGYGFDCSGLVMEAYKHAGFRLPRTTYEMIAAIGNGWLFVTQHPHKGDLAFYGDGHVELYQQRGVTFGAHDYGSPVGWIHYNRWWFPTFFVRVR